MGQILFGPFFYVKYLCLFGGTLSICSSPFFLISSHTWPDSLIHITYLGPSGVWVCGSHRFIQTVCYGWFSLSTAPRWKRFISEGGSTHETHKSYQPTMHPANSLWAPITCWAWCEESGIEREVVKTLHQSWERTYKLCVGGCEHVRSQRCREISKGPRGEGSFELGMGGLGVHQLEVWR